MTSLGDFRPFPLLGNGHVQTILGHWLAGPALQQPARRQALTLPDGDVLLLYHSVPARWRPGDPIAILVHGLTGTHASAGIQRMARLFLRRHVRVLRLDLRGAGAGLPLARRFYHAGISEDLRAVVTEVHRACPESPLLLLGVSLGGNLVLKLLGEVSADPLPGVVRAAALGPPIDLARCVALFEAPGNRIYEKFFLRDLVNDARRRQRHFPDLPSLRLPRRLSLRQYDDLYTAPRSGFAGAEDYYARCSAGPLLGRIAVPTLVLTARDDPFIAVEPFEEAVPAPHVHLHILPRGGHLGFLGWDGLGGVRWAEHRLVEWALHGGPAAPHAPPA